MIEILAIVVVALVIHYFQSRRVDGFLMSRYLPALAMIALALALLLCRLAWEITLAGDEIEHIHSGWYVDQGRIPFTDFFQHHHSLFWYAMIPVFDVFGHTIAAIKALRMAMAAQALAIGWVTYRIAVVSTRSREVGALAVIFLFSWILFVESALEVRPDVPQTLAGLISIYDLLLYLRHGRRRYIAYSALAAGISFVFLQKAVLLLASYSLLMGWLYFKKRLNWKDLLLFVAFFSLPLLGYLAWLVYTGSLQDYIFTNWRMNLHFARRSPAWLLMGRTLRENTVFWLLGLGAAAVVLWRSNNSGARIVAFLGLTLFGLLFLLKRVHDQYFLPALPVLCVSAAIGLAWLFERLRLNSFYKLLLVLLILAQPVHYARNAKRLTANNHTQLRKLKFVLDHTMPTDFVYDGMTNYNVFRPDIHYFWYSLKDDRGLQTYKNLTNDRLGKIDFVALIRMKKPVIISDYAYDFPQSGLAEQYVQTKYKQMYMRKADAR